MPGGGRVISGLHAVVAALGLLATPAGGYHGTYQHGHAASFRVGAAVTSFTPPLHGQLTPDPASSCAGASAFTGSLTFAC